MIPTLCHTILLTFTHKTTDNSSNCVTIRDIFHYYIKHVTGLKVQRMK